MADVQLLRDVERHLNSAELRQNLTPLFCQTLNWGGPQGQPIRLAVGTPVSRTLTAIPVAQLGGLPVFRVDWDSDRLPNVTQRRAVHRALTPTYVEHLLCYITQDGKQAAFVWAHKRDEEKGKEERKKVELRTLPYEVGSPARTTIERLGELAFTYDELARWQPLRQRGEPPVPVVKDKLNKAFDVEAVTRRFFEDYRTVFADLQDRLYRATRDKVWAHDYALQLLNRLMFLYFIQRKRWLGNNPNFIRTFWEAYVAQTDGLRRVQTDSLRHVVQTDSLRRVVQTDSLRHKDSFFEHWLSVLFFEAFNEKFQAGRHDRQHFPPEIRDALASAPYLNGGLFTRNQLDEKYHVTLPDDFFVMLFDRFNGSTPGFFERYNFTITESTPFDIEVAVDPEMIGKVYESLVNITFEGLTEEDLRGTAGIFYTPRVEIDLMCRLALVDYLANHVTQTVSLRTQSDSLRTQSDRLRYKSLLYQAVFAYEPQEKEEADEALARENLWEELNRLLREVTVCDPACGSGSFLVGMLLVLDDLQERANRVLGIEETPYERRRRIIGQSLYGVDVMDWAVHVAELRLWLQLVVETELEPAELKFRPLLPNLSFKIRQGDSLVQEVGGINFGLHGRQLDIPRDLKGRLTKLKGEKLKFYHGDPNARYRTEEELKREELRLFRDIVAAKQETVSRRLQEVRRRIEATRTTLMGEKVPEADAKTLQRLREEQAAYELEEDRLRRLREALIAYGEERLTQVPFVWDIAFVEIFEGDKGGFDIVLGNPPYVRQEKIAPPTLREQDYTPEQWRQLKAEYKAKLQNSVAAAYPHFFKGRKLDGRSDLYVYFYLHGLSLLNDKGSFCFITSNSWLDVGYGKDLQEFLLKHSHVKMILDNEAKRTFAQADINTIIALLAPPVTQTVAQSVAQSVRLQPTQTDSLRYARFVMFKVPFEEVMSPIVFEEIEEATDRLVRPEFRVCVLSHQALYEEGLATSSAIGQIAQERGAICQIAQKRGAICQIAPRAICQIALQERTYEGNKWGGKYLRAPDIFFTILEKGRVGAKHASPLLVRLGDIAEVRFGIKTGANEFFYLEPTGKSAPKGYLHVRNGAGWEGELEEEFLKPVIKSPRECRSIVIKPEDLKFKIFMCHKDKRELRGTNALEYIKWGESQGFHKRPTCRARQRWWDVGERQAAPLCFNKGPWDRHFVPVNNIGAFTDQQVYVVFPDIDIDVEVLKAVANCTMGGGFLETIGRSNFGEGILWIAVYEAAQMPVLNPSALTPFQRERLLSVFGQMASREIRNIFDEVHQPDRRALDDVVFDVLGLTAGEREAVYEAVVELVRRRLEKARSV